MHRGDQGGCLPHLGHRQVGPDVKQITSASRAGALAVGVVVPRCIGAPRADAFRTSDTGKSACATPPAAHHRPSTRVPKQLFPDLALRGRAHDAHLATAPGLISRAAKAGSDHQGACLPAERDGGKTG